MLILITRHEKVFFEKIYLSNIENGVMTPKTPFSTLLPRDILSYQGLRLSILSKGRYDVTFAGEDGLGSVCLDIFENFFHVCNANTSTDKKCILKICN